MSERPSKSFNRSKDCIETVECFDDIFVRLFKIITFHSHLHTRCTVDTQIKLVFIL